MLQSKGAGEEEDPCFKWGAKRETARNARKNHNVSFYESFTLDGIEYRLLDTAYFFVYGQCETSIGKLVNMYETSKGEKKVKVIWFFRPSDIRSFLGEYEPQWNELFLACGDETGVYNINDVEAIMGKCNVLCLSRDSKNPRPYINELRRTNYVFSRTFDTKLKIISEDFPDAIAGIGVEKFFNKINVQQPLKRQNSTAAASSRASPVKSFQLESRSAKLVKKDNRDGKLMSSTRPENRDGKLMSSTRPGNRDGKLMSSTRSENIDGKLTSRPSPVKKVSFLETSKTKVLRDSSVDPRPSKKRKLILNMPETDDSSPQLGEKKFIKKPPLAEKAPIGKIDKKCSWYNKLPFEEELKAAIKKDRLLVIENLEPSYTSMEVEELCRQAFNERVDAKMIPSSLVSSRRNGRAIVIFETTKAADNAMSRLAEGCLMLPDQRPLVGSRKVPIEIGIPRSVPGNFSLNDRSLMQFHKKMAVSTSHCAQPNHIVYPMAFEWLALQKKTESMWKKLFEVQAKEIKIVRRQNHQGTRGNG